MVTVTIHGLPIKSDRNTKRMLCTYSENRVRTELSIPATGQKDRGLWGRECRHARAHSRPQSSSLLCMMDGEKSSGSNHFEITKEITDICPSGLTQPSSMAHARNCCSQTSRFLPQARRIEGSGDENGVPLTTPFHYLLLVETKKARLIGQSATPCWYTSDVHQHGGRT